MAVKVRFAPSPTGQLHVGNIRPALMNWLFAAQSGGVFMLRIDDTDVERSTAAFEQGIFDDMQWLGLAHGETAKQSERFDRYAAVAEELKARGLLYPCYESADELDRQRKIQRSQNKPPVYNRAALTLSDADRARLEAEGRKAHWRFKLSGGNVQWQDVIRGEQNIDTASLSDPILIRGDGSYLYTLPSVIDDADFSISHIIRGEDHVTNSAAQLEIFRAIGATAPAMGHHPLLVGANGDKLSKRLGTLSIAGLRDDEGIEPMAILSLLAKIGTSDPVEIRSDLSQLVDEFSFEKIGRAPARFDPAELKTLNAKLLHEMPYTEVADRLADMGGEHGPSFWEAIRGNIETLADVTYWQGVVYDTITPVIADEDAEYIREAAGLLPKGALNETSWSNWTAILKEKTGRKGRGLFLPLRLALTGQKHGPDMGAILALMDRDRVLARLNR
jgi:glutamyl-tRNA synthetase